MPAPRDPEKYEKWVKNIGKASKGRPSPMKGKKHNEESKQKMSISHKGKVSLKSIQTLIDYVKTHKPQGMKGKHLSEKHKQILITANTDRKCSEKTRKKIALAHIGLKPSEESRRKMSLAKIGKSTWNKGKKLHYDVWNKDKKGVMPTPWNKGKHGYLSEETRQRLSKIRKGRSPTNKGQKMSEEFRVKCQEHRATQKFPIRDTKIERKLQQLLDELHIKYRKHSPVYHPKMGYHQVDIMFVDHEGNPKIAVECDGCYWHGCLEHCQTSKIGEKNTQRDRLVDSCLKELGIKVIRLWEHDINSGKIPIEIYNVGDDE